MVREGWRAVGKVMARQDTSEGRADGSQSAPRKPNYFLRKEEVRLEIDVVVSLQEGWLPVGGKGSPRSGLCYYYVAEHRPASWYRATS